MKRLTERLRDLFVGPSGQRTDEDLGPATLDALIRDRTPIHDCVARQGCTVGGTVTSLGPVSNRDRTSFQVMLDDGSGTSMRARWLGQSKVPGIRVGSILRLRGTPQAERSGFLMIDPAYTILR